MPPPEGEIMRFRNLLPHILLALCILIMLAPAFEPGRLMSQFHPSRLAEVHSLDERCLGQQGWIAGWDSRFQCGYPAGFYQYQLSYLLMCALHRAAGIPLDFCYKLLFVLGIWFAAAMFMRLLGRLVGPWPALAFTLAFFASHSILWQIEWGYWNQVMALGLLCLFVDRLARTERLGARSVLVLAGLYALIVPAHQFTSIAAGLILLAWLPQFVRRQGWGVILPWAMIPLGAILLTLSYSYPIIQTRHWMGSQPAGMDQSQRLLSAMLSALGLAGLDPMAQAGVAARLKGLIEDWPVWLALALAASLLPLWRAGRLSGKERRLCGGLALALLPFAFIGFDLMMLIPSPALHQMTRQIAGQRFLLYLHFCLFLLAALAARHWLQQAARSHDCSTPSGSGTFWGRLPRVALRSTRGYSNTIPSGSGGGADGNTIARSGRTWLHLKPLAWGAGLIVALTFLKAAYSLVHNGYLETDRSCAGMEDVRKVWGWLGAHNGEHCRVLYESTFLNYPVRAGDRASQVLHQSTVMALGPLETGMPEAGALLNIVLPMFDHTRTSNGTVMGQKIGAASTGQIKPLLKEGNFGYVVTCTTPLATMLASDSAFRARVAFGPFTIFHYEEAPGNWAVVDEKDPATVIVDPDNDAHLTIVLNDSRPGSRLLVRQAWHPYWQATANGRPLALSPTDFGQIQARLGGEGPLLIELNFSARRPGLIRINLLALAGLGAGLWITRVKARATAGSFDFAEDQALQPASGDKDRKALPHPEEKVREGLTVFRPKTYKPAEGEPS